MSKTWSVSDRPRPPSADRIRVGVADAAVTDDGKTIVTSGLGSCVGIALYDGSGVGGLLHAMLPEAPETIDKPAKYVDSGVDLLVDRMTDLGAKQTSLKGKLTGGSSMLDLGGETPVGEKNVEAAMKRLEAANVEVVAEETGGNIGRSVAFTPATGHLRVKRVDEEVHEI